MRRKKFITNILICSMLSGLLVGCGSTSEVSSTATQESTKTSSKGEKAFTYWIPMHAVTSKYFTDLNQNPGAERIQEKTGINVDYVSPPIGQENNQFNTMLASGKNMPDCFRYDLINKYNGGVDLAIEDGVIIDATKLIEEHAPNFMAFVKSDKNIKKAAYTDGGHICKFGAILPAKEMKDRPFNGPILNKTLLDKTGLPVPETIEDWEKVLAAFKEMGVKIPYTFGCDDTFYALHNTFASAYGVPAGSRFMRIDNKVSFGPLQPGYKEWVTEFNKWYKNGWLDPDFLSKNLNKDIAPNFHGGSVIGAATIHIGALEKLPLTSEKKGEKQEAVPAPYPVLKKGDKVHFRHRIGNFTGTPIFISSEAKDPETIVEWIDWFYGPEGILETNWGVKGDSRYEDTYKETADGQKEYSDAIMNDPDGVDAYRHYILRDNQLVWSWDNQSYQYKNPVYQEAWDAWSNSDDAYMMPDELSLTPEEADEFSKIMEDIDTYTCEMTAKFIMDIEPVQNYDNFTNTLKKMNIDRAIEIQQAALDRYNAR